MVIGKVGSGKSWGTLSLCQLLDPDFKLEGNWFFKAGAFMRAVTNYYSKPRFKKGKIWVLDEAGVDLNYANYQNEVNKGLNVFLQTARSRNYIFFGTVPYLSFISKGVRKMITAQFTAMGHNTLKQTKFLPRVLEYEDEYDKFYKKRLIIKVNDCEIFCNEMMLPKPTKEIIKEYEALKKQFQVNLEDNTASSIEAYEEKQTEKVYGKKITDQHEKIIKMLAQGLIVPQIAKIMDVTEQNIYHHFKTMKEHGIEIVPIKKKKAIVRYEVINHREKIIVKAENPGAENKKRFRFKNIVWKNLQKTKIL